MVLCDHLMPGTKGVDFLIELEKNPETKAARKVLVTGQASHQDTIAAINIGGLDHYIAKPWQIQEFDSVVRRLLTDFILEVDESPAKYASVLDFARIMEAIHAREV
jgi:response regulator RpfG family c-di-GMP phosphodiesterase